MNKLYTLLLTLLLVYTASAQTDFARLPIAPPNPSHVLTAVNPTGDVCVLAFVESAMYSSIVNAQGEHMASGSFIFGPNEKAEALGVISLADHFIYFENKAGSMKHVQPYRIEKNSGKITVLEPLKPTLDKDSKLVQAYIYNSRLYTLYYSKETKRLQVCEFKNALDLSVKNFHVPVLKLYDRLLKGESPANPVFIDKDMEQTLATGYRHKKIYHEADNIYIVFDAFGAQRMNISNLTTEVLQLNLATEQADFRALPLVYKIRPFGMNSYMHQGTLYRFLATPDNAVYLSAYDLQTLALKKEYHYKKTEPLTIKASPVYKNKQKPGRADTTIVETTDDVLKKVSTGGASAILVDEVEPATLRFTIGTYTSLTNSNAAYLPSGTSLLAHAGPAAIPVVAAIAAAKVQSANTSELMASFNIYLHKENLEPAAKVEIPSYYEQISAYGLQLAEQKIQVLAPFAYAYQNRMFYGYFNRKSNAIHIVSFAKQ